MSTSNAVSVWSRLAKGARSPGSIAFVASHLALVGIFWSGVTWQALVACAALFVIRMWGVTAGYHRYFSHRSFKTSRVFQFVLAVLAQSSAQKGVLWWASHHRRHHKLSDQEGDPHSPILDGFLYSHMGWILSDGEEATEFDRIRDLARYPELVWLNKHYFVPPLVLALVMWAWLGLPGLLVGFFASTVLIWHSTFAINSLAHVRGRRRFATTDHSRNNFPLAVLTLGEGWHNNHHHYQSSARNGFYWWEIDVTYYVLCALSWVGIVWDLRPVPERVLAEGREQDRAQALGDVVAPLPDVA